MNILVITRSCWDNTNNIGNTMTNIFNQLSGKCNIYNLYFRSQEPNNDICISAYQISEIKLIKSIINRRPVGIDIPRTDFLKADKFAKQYEASIYNKAKHYDSSILWFIRELFWTFGNWKNQNCLSYIQKVNPDIIFMPVFGCYYPHKVLRYIAQNTSAKIILFHADDNYSLRQFSLSPLYWIYRFGLRKWVRNSVKLSSLNYVISEVQKNEYEKCFKKKFSILTKGADFSHKPEDRMIDFNNIKMVFTGNISAGRWKSLAKIGEALNIVNSDYMKAELYIYTLTPITSKMHKTLDKRYIHLMGGVDSNKISQIQSDADILVHVESLALKERLKVRQSFSTKIVDYLSSARCIFAIGTRDLASIDYLIKNDAALVASNEEEITHQLKRIFKNPTIISKYAYKAWQCGGKNHQISIIQKKLYDDMRTILKE